MNVLYIWIFKLALLAAVRCPTYVAIRGAGPAARAYVRTYVLLDFPLIKQKWSVSTFKQFKTSLWSYKL